MDKRKIANKLVKDSLFKALVEILEEDKVISNISITDLIKKAGVARSSFYRNFKSIEEIIDYGIQQVIDEYDKNKPTEHEDFRNKDLIHYKFKFYKSHAGLLLAFRKVRGTLSLLDLITNYVLDAYGDMPSSSIRKYELYYYSGAFYNMLMSWLENGAKESSEDMANEFLRILGENE